MQQQLKQQLYALEQVLKQNTLWSEGMPSEQALASQQPFAIDYLEAHQWLQWIFIPKMHALIESNYPLPSQIAISPYIEEALKEHENLADLLQPLLAIEELLQQNKP